MQLNQTTGLIIVDHGSKREQSNQALLKVVSMFKEITGHTIVEPAHMELAEPSIAKAFDRCVRRGATLVVVHPYFLLPGRHWEQDIPRLAASASARHPGVWHLVTAPLGIHHAMVEIMTDRIEQCLSHAQGQSDA